MRAFNRTFTLIEVMIAAVVFMVVMGLALLLLANSNTSVGESTNMTEASMRANQLENMIRAELQGSDNFITSSAGGAALTTPYAPAGRATVLDYVRVTNYTGGSAVTVSRRLRFVLEDGNDTTLPSGNGSDNDNDGLIDEGRIELLESGTVKAVLARNVSGQTFQFDTLAQPNNEPFSGVRVIFDVIVRLGKDPKPPFADRIHFERRDLWFPSKN